MRLRLAWVGLVVDLSAGPTPASYPVSYLDSIPSPVPDAYKLTRLLLRRVPASTFTMGSPTDELGRELWDKGNETQHQVELTKAFYVGVFEVTQKQWDLAMGGINPSNYKGDRRPVEYVSWNSIRGGTWPGSPAGSGAPGAGTFVDRLRSTTGGLLFDLPTEAQWEYACRAGTMTALNSGENVTSTGRDRDGEMDRVGRYWCDRGDGRGGYSDAHTAIGSYVANAWGLYDMHGNVSEWCLDWYGTYPGTVSDPTGPGSGSSRVERGGSWIAFALYCRSANRAVDSSGSRYNSLGFRLVRNGL
jgi:formylglycine-generating enzyme required for sulfatase activity